MLPFDECMYFPEQSTDAADNSEHGKSLACGERNKSQSHAPHMTLQASIGSLLHIMRGKSVCEQLKGTQNPCTGAHLALARVKETLTALTMCSRPEMCLQ